MQLLNLLYIFLSENIIKRRATITLFPEDTPLIKKGDAIAYMY